MAGHNKWAQIKHQKGVADARRGKEFSKLLRAITVAAKEESDPKFNPRLRSAIQKAKEKKVPQENIDRALKKVSGEGTDLEELLCGAYDKSGAALLIEVLTDNRNRTVAELKKLLHDYDAKWADPGGVAWAFERVELDGSVIWRPKFMQEVNQTDKEAFERLINELNAHDDVQATYSNGVALKK